MISNKREKRNNVDEWNATVNKWSETKEKRNRLDKWNATKGIRETDDELNRYQNWTS